MGTESKVRALRVVVKDRNAEWTLNKVVGEALEYEDSGSVNLYEEPLAAQRIKNLTNIIKDLRHALRQAGPDEEVAKTATRVATRIAEMLGDELYQYLFRNSLDKKYHQVLADLRGSKKSPVDVLRISLEFQESASRLLGGWPWEYLHSPKRDNVGYSGHFLALETELMLSRRVFEKPQSLEFRSPLKVLLVVSMPDQRGEVLGNAVLSTLNDLKEATANEEKMKERGYKIKFKLDKLIDKPKEEALLDPNYSYQATRVNLEKTVRAYEPHIVHFIGHGRFDNDENRASIDLIQAGFRPDPVAEEEFATRIKNANLRLVFLQACESAIGDPFTNASGMARSLALQQIPAIIAMQDKIENIAAGEFACAFYEELAKTRSIDKAVTAGRKAIHDQSDASQRVAFAVPVLYLESQIGLLTEAEVTPPDGGSIPPPIDTRQLRPCPRCNTMLDMAKAEFCTNCALRFCCDSGRPQCRGKQNRYLEPLGNFCHSCGAKIQQEPWSPAAPDSREKGPPKPPW